MKKNSLPIYLITLILINVYSVNAQTINLGEVAVSTHTKVSVHSDFINSNSADFINDGELYFYKNIKNEGLFTFTSGKESFIFLNGKAPQTIVGGLPIELYNVQFNNTASQPAFRLGGDLKIFGTADFINGIVDNVSLGGYVTFDSGSSSFNMADDSFVNGSVEKRGQDAFTFPIGSNGFYRQAAIATLNVTDKITSKYSLENSNTEFPHANISGNTIEFINNTEYWKVEGVTINPEMVLTLSWNNNTTSQQLLAGLNENNIHIVRWDPKIKKWVDEGGIVDISNKTITTPTQVSGYGIFTLARITAPSVKPLLDIYNAVSPDGDGNNDYFIIGNLEKYPNNTVEIFNRWGVKVFETTNYGSTGNVFKGISEGRATLNREGKLQTGTYFYIINYQYTEDGKTKTDKKSGYLYLNND